MIEQILATFQPQGKVQKVQPASLRTIHSLRPVFDLHDSSNVVDLTIEQNLRSKSQEQQLRKRRRTRTQSATNATRSRNRVSQFTEPDTPKEAGKTSGRPSMMSLSIDEHTNSDIKAG